MYFRFNTKFRDAFVMITRSNVGDVPDYEMAFLINAIYWDCINFEQLKSALYVLSKLPYLLIGNLLNNIDSYIENLELNVNVAK